MAATGLTMRREWELVFFEMPLQVPLWLDGGHTISLCRCAKIEISVSYMVSLGVILEEFDQFAMQIHNFRDKRVEKNLYIPPLRPNLKIMLR